MKHYKIIFPRWYWPDNLGDSLVFCIVPHIIKTLKPNATIEVVTYGSLIPLLIHNNDVNVCRLPNPDELKNPYYYVSKSLQNNIETNSEIVIYPENHPKLFSTYKAHFDKLTNHDSINFIVLNYLLQLNCLNEFIDRSDFYNFPNTLSNTKQSNSKKLIALCPVTKLNGKSSPHPDCNGIGYRFNGDKGKESWLRLFTKLKTLVDVDFVEISTSPIGFGVDIIGKKETLLDLYLDTQNIDYAITNDGGLHHLFNLHKTPLTLFTGTKVTKPEFMKLGNAYVPDVHLDCRKHCKSFYTDVFGGDDLSLNCKLECENINPEVLATLISKDIKNRIL